MQENFLISYLFTTIQLNDLILVDDVDVIVIVIVIVIVVVVVLNSSEAHSNKVTGYIIVTFLWLVV